MTSLYGVTVTLYLKVDDPREAVLAAIDEMEGVDLRCRLFEVKDMESAECFVLTGDGDFVSEPVVASDPTPDAAPSPVVAGQSSDDVSELLEEQAKLRGFGDGENEVRSVDQRGVLTKKERLLAEARFLLGEGPEPPAEPPARRNGLFGR